MSGPAPADGADQVVARLRAAGCVWAEAEAELLLETAGSPAELESLVARRAAGEPLELVLGWADFLGRRLRVAPGVFVPRRRTELLARTALAEAAARARPGGEAVVVVEMCCGVATVAACLPAGVEVHAADVSAVALDCARTNAPRAALHEGDLYDALPHGLRGRVDVLAANAPYVPTDRIAEMPPEAREHEPLTALDGGADGIDLHRRLAAAAPEWLAPGGVLVVETGRPQSTLTAGAMATAGLTTQVVEDPAVDGCVVLGVSPSTARQGQGRGGAGVTIPTAASASSICSREMPSR
jgi:release factor glutamine methyltransferase